MSNSTCKTIQRMLDEMLLDDECSVEVRHHLTQCSACSDFHLKQTRLRQVVGSLGTVPAPSDFDFRLRSRLANESGKSSFHSISLWSLGRRTAAAGITLAVLFGAVLLVRQLTTQEVPKNEISQRGVPQDQKPQAVAPESSPNQQRTTQESEHLTASVPPSRNAGGKRTISNVQRVKRATAVAEMSSEGANVVRGPGAVEGSEAIFPIDASQQSLKVSLFDSRGNPRTISLPTVSFGSQRVVPSASSFAPKGVW